MVKQVITCDICGGPSTTGKTIGVIERSGTMSHPHTYSDICTKCETQIGQFIRTLQNETNGKQDELR